MIQITHRLPNWEKHYHSVIARREWKPFHRRLNDCVRFTALMIFEITGVKLGEEFTKQYRSDLGASRLLSKLGKDGFLHAADKVLTQVGIQPCDWRMAQRGDPVFFSGDVGKNELEQGLGICVGQYAMSPGLKGLIKIPMNRAKAAWHIPF